MEITIPSTRTALRQNHPNPFNPSTTISFSLRERESARIVVHDLAGRHVATLHDGILPAGHHSVEWDGRDSRGRRVASGAYLYTLRTPTLTLSRKFALLE